jgi:transcription elongation factor Elf1
MNEFECIKCGSICQIDGEFPKFFAYCDVCGDYAKGFDADDYTRDIAAGIADSRDKNNE